MFALQQDAYIAAGFGEAAFQNQTNVSPVGLAALALCSLAAISVSRKHALAPLIALASLVSTGQRVAILTLDFNFVRLILLAYALRILVRGDWKGARLRTVDKLVIGWVTISSIAYVLLQGKSGALVYQAGQVYDRLGLYTVFRLYLRDARDFGRACRIIAMIAVPVGLAFLIERATGRNLFATFGGVPEFTRVREGRLRCQGPYVHPILAGVYWVGFLPLLATMAIKGKGRDRPLGLIAAAAASCVILTCASSTPLIGVLAGIGFGLTWGLRRYLPAAAFALVVTMIALHFAREQPVWQLISRAGVVGGSTALHRYRLIDAFFRNWEEWLFLGTKGTAHWGFYLFDLTNQYVKEGVRGGILGLLLFNSALGLSISRLWKSSMRRASVVSSRRHAWAALTGLFALAVMFIGVSITHANQNVMVLMFLLASASTDFGSLRKLIHRGPLSLPTGANQSSAAAN